MDRLIFQSADLTKAFASSKIHRKEETPLSVKIGTFSILNGFQSPLSNSQFEFFQLFVEGFR